METLEPPLNPPLIIPVAEVFPVLDSMLYQMTLMSGMHEFQATDM